MREREQDRGTGRTTKMVKELKPGATVVVHNIPLRAYVQDMVRTLRGPNFHATVVSVYDHWEIEKLHGRDNIVVDHSFWECAPHQTRDEMQHFLKTRRN